MTQLADAIALQTLYIWTNLFDMRTNRTRHALRYNDEFVRLGMHNVFRRWLRDRNGKTWLYYGDYCNTLRQPEL